MSTTIRSPREQAPPEDHEGGRGDGGYGGDNYGPQQPSPERGGKGKWWAIGAGGTALALVGTILAVGNSNNETTPEPTPTSASGESPTAANPETTLDNGAVVVDLSEDAEVAPTDSAKVESLIDQLPAEFIAHVEQRVEAVSPENMQGKSPEQIDQLFAITVGDLETLGGDPELVAVGYVHLYNGLGEKKVNAGFTEADWLASADHPGSDNRYTRFAEFVNKNYVVPATQAFQDPESVNQLPTSQARTFALYEDITADEGQDVLGDFVVEQDLFPESIEVNQPGDGNNTPLSVSYQMRFWQPNTLEGTEDYNKLVNEWGVVDRSRADELDVDFINQIELTGVIADADGRLYPSEINVTTTDNRSLDN